MDDLFVEGPLHGLRPHGEFVWCAVTVYTSQVVQNLQAIPLGMFGLEWLDMMKRGDQVGGQVL